MNKHPTKLSHKTKQDTLLKQITIALKKTLALVFKEDVLTYKLLNEKANQLANYLLQQGISVEDHVAIWLKPRAEMLISILAILKAGGAYVPIDANNPSERIKHLLQDSQPKIIITETTYLKVILLPNF